MKNLYLSLLILAFPFSLLAQNIHGIWSGTMVNDTLRVTQNLEMGLSEYRGKITGYTYQTYIIRDTFYYSVKKIKAERKDGFLVVEDVERIADNFPDKAARKVRMTTKYPLINDSTFDFTKGHWSTNQTKIYYSVGGDIRLKELEDEKQSDLLAHLQEMNVKTDIAASKKDKKKEEPIVRNHIEVKSKPQQTNDQKPVENKNNDVVKNSTPLPAANTAAKITTTPKPDSLQMLAVANKKKEATIDIKEQPVATSNTSVNKPTQAPNLKNDVVANVGGNQSGNGNNSIVNRSSQTQIVEKKKPEVVQVSQKNDQPINNKTEEQKNISVVPINKPVSQQKEMTVPAKELPTIVADRKNETMQDTYFKNDSLILSLYDNGIVDGDTVSVFMNGENIISKQKLKESAIKKTIYVPANSDSLQLVLFAENLGTIPPNTGLLTVRDGDDVYQVRFSADLQKNASIILRRKK
ncbi:MAG TPA: hypothetical protein VE933_06310 [Chitinophagaceae bacterium]|nr:hypothetical protein [Chitinophagaceae bacterium]